MGFESVQNTAKPHDTADSSCVVPLNPRRKVTPHASEVAKLATEVGRALRGGNLERAKVLNEELRRLIAAMEEGTE